MKQRSVLRIFCMFFLVVTLYILFISFSLAGNNSSANSTNTNASRSTTNVIASSTTTQNQTKIEKAFECLVTNLGSNCTGATTVQQLSFSILASTNITEKCVGQLLKKERTSGCFGDNNNCGIKETALAILALNHVGRNTTKAVDWLIAQNKTSSDVEWFLQQDSVGQVDCKLTYGLADYFFSAAENKKLTGSVGNCFSFAHNNYWLRLDESCFNKDFILSCNKEFFAGWHYKNPGSPVLNVLSETARRKANDPVTLRINSRCFGSRSGCDFEDTAWAALALKKVGKNIEAFVPYLISAEDSNTIYFPAALNYLILEYSTLYGNKVVQQQKNSQYWEAENSAYGSVYDTALAFLTFPKGSNQEQVRNARDWALNFKQDRNGCWNFNNIRDTAFMIWALEQKPAERVSTSSEAIISPTTRCGTGGNKFVCSGQLACLSVGGEILSGYDCSHEGFNQVCCSKNPVQSCSEMLGRVCLSGKVCSGMERTSSTGTCCLAECVEPINQTTECARYGYACRDSCLSSQQEEPYSCSKEQVCCSRKESSGRSGVPLWLWLLVGIVFVLIVLAVVFKSRIKVWFYKRKKDSRGEASTSQRPPFGPGGPPRPGFPPLIRPIGRPIMPSQRPIQRRSFNPEQNPRLDDAFARLKEMTK